MGVMSVEVDSFDGERLDALIWRYIGVRSVREIAELAGVAPEVVLRRKSELLDEVDVLSIAERRQRVVVELDGMARDARERALGASDEYMSGLLNSSVSALKAMLAELARLEKQDLGAVEELNRLRVRELLSLVDEVVVESVRVISVEHGIPESVLMGVFQERLLSVARDRELE